MIKAILIIFVLALAGCSHTAFAPCAEKPPKSTLHKYRNCPEISKF